MRRLIFSHGDLDWFIAVEQVWIRASWCSFLVVVIGKKTFRVKEGALLWELVAELGPDPEGKGKAPAFPLGKVQHGLLFWKRWLT